MAIYDLTKDYEQDKAQKNLKRLTKKGSTIEIIDKTLEQEEKTWSQIKYLHLLISIIALELGYTLDEMKLELKRNPFKKWMIYKKNKNSFIRSFADVSKVELSKMIDLLLNWAPHIHGISLPEADDTTALVKAKDYIRRNRQFL